MSGIMKNKCPIAIDSKHLWSYDHRIYGHPKGLSEDKVVIHRQCYICGKHEMAVASTWKKPYPGYDLPDVTGMTW
jgi:hypothetical protein